ncbi:hypothetical protein M422DRAFT_29676 [Sphaerobolus stellatus SS14]|uniref:DNA repair protein RAD14 n=1 Tax=Sphaerobolus stellatus (strain SS14) TaxID=990650 RepID=A0A0C9W1V6_SPHS4|nr:hypothetical protein M422DRAFT_29676 [Sphaerobolus stellatus SS14]
MADRPTTPPPSTSNVQQLSLTPDQVKRIELNRLKAKARQRALDAAASSSASKLNVNNKRPLEVVSADSKSPTAPKPLKRDSRLGKYFDYDLSKMINSKGGFLVDEGKEVDENERAKQRQRERERAMANIEPPLFLDNSMNPKCNECQSLDIDHSFKKVFHVLVCHKCKQDKPEKYSLLTKTECKQDYLLTDPELRDEELMPHMLKANPHHSTFSNMMLYLRMHVEDFAWKKWGSPEALDAEWEKRENEKKKKRGKKFEEGLRDLRRRTKETVWQRRRDAEHQHTYGLAEAGDDGVGTQRCTECGFEIEVEEL